ncbi:putative formate dehydrogenase [Alloalcanivorax dieselolei B5]|uniref:Putative formate dehydrogenase n=1 Tax=Alcanivorax dieselolei (strain DSM 16502 / CGMCC 1.3690 / MCCC 1A00001 / B-5) TaxID=930169 RepID=K0CI02_ALCDB|nr:substrate-binding domain-containing protein [Alloalcanivorax dieselolei]AFT71211.1 putative formate dehydrogenase [Alloalcanivorax dieselolei B5]GGJ93943.1 formate dehydrogenase [Alloalcanivorax dieselolei]
MPNKKLRISPAWVFTTEQGELFDPVVFRLLEGVRDSGKLTMAARDAGISYRHAWNLLNRGADFFGLPLVRMRKGHGTRLSPLGEKLLWSEQRLKARLGPQIHSLASELNTQLQQLLAGAHPVLRLHASHGYAVALLPDFSDWVELDLQYTNPANALNVLARGESDLASFHFPVCPRLADQVMAIYQHQLDLDNLRVIRFVTRKQGLIVRHENRAAVGGLRDLTNPDIRFINRDRYSGTRVLFNLLLREQGIALDAIRGSDQEEFTHTAVAAYVAAGMADAGFGVEAAARQFGLEFIELANEHYLLVCHKDKLEHDTLRQLLDLMRSPEFGDELDTLPGYAPDRCGEVCTFAQLLAGDRHPGPGPV